jgi:hypothetical protein
MIGVTQVFSIYINDLVAHFDESCDSVKLMERNLSCLLYADDLVLSWVEILDFSDIKSCLIQNKYLVAFLHNISTAFVKIPEGLEIIPNLVLNPLEFLYLYSIPR